MARGTATPANIGKKIGGTRFENGKMTLLERTVAGLFKVFFDASEGAHIAAPVDIHLYKYLPKLEKEGFLRSREIEKTGPVIEDDAIERLEDYQPEKLSNREYFLTGVGRRQPKPKDSPSSSAAYIPT